jgi:hypothetical protein
LAAAGLTGGRAGAGITFGLPGSVGFAAAAGGLAATAGAFAAGAGVAGLAAGRLATGVAGLAAGCLATGVAFFAAFFTGVFLAAALAGAFLAAAFLAPETAVGRSARPELLKLVRSRSATSESIPLRLDLTWMPIFSRVAMISSAGTPVSFASL